MRNSRMLILGLTAAGLALGGAANAASTTTKSTTVAGKTHHVTKVKKVSSAKPHGATVQKTSVSTTTKKD